jgi:peptide chain release factor 3
MVVGSMDQIEREANRRRTFAIISHPDAGKTTLTEKLLLYSNAIHLAGAVKSRKATRHAISDWMQMEQERGISITSSVLQFAYQESTLNLLDTPGHADFSEDTFRTLAAVDSAVMLMDHSKGVEPRTKKLFEVCRQRKVPVVTFMNKLDRPGLDPLELIDDVTKQLDLRVAPMTWPLGMGREFVGVVDVKTRDVTMYEPGKRKGAQLISRTISWEEAEIELDEAVLQKASDDLALIVEAGEQYDHERFLAGELSPLFWGSAMTDFGVDALLDYLVAGAARPGPRVTEDGKVISPNREEFAGFVFKIQANMNPKHRDRIAFMRVVSGKFERNMDVVIGRSGEKVRMASPHTFMAQERSIVDEAWPGDIVGIFDSGKLRVGDTLSAGDPLRFAGIPRFAPEHFGQLRLRDPMKRKQLDLGLEQLAHEGVIQLFFRKETGRQNPYLGAVGLLQFEVLKERLKNEYGVDAVFQPLKFNHARWIGGSKEALVWLEAGRDYAVLEDRNGHPVLLTETPWAINYALEHAPGLELYDVEPL